MTSECSIKKVYQTAASNQGVEVSAERNLTKDCLAIEEPLQIKICHPVDRAVAVTMRTPGADIDLALGFLFSEGIINSSEQVKDVKRCGVKQSVVSVSLSEDFNIEAIGERNFFATSSCGVCGKASIDSIRSLSVFAPNFSAKIDRKILFSLGLKLSQQQIAFQQTGGIHAAGLFDLAGDLIAVREDIGRHNAVDKIIGHFFQTRKLPLSKSILFLSGRASFELIQKAAMAAIPIVAAVGAPSSLAVDLATELGITLVGFLGESRFNIYSHESRLKC